MPSIFKTPDEIIRAGFQESKNFLAPDVPSAVKDRIEKIDSYDALVSMLRDEGKLPEDEVHTIAASILYGLLERAGVDPEEWKLAASPVDIKNVRYGTEELKEARKFYGSWTELGVIALAIASMGSLGIAGIGTLLAARTIGTIGVALRAGKGVTAIKTILDIAKFRGIKWLSIPSVITAIGTMGAMFANVQLTATGDLEGYLRQGVARGEEKEKEQQKTGSTFGTTYRRTEVTRITQSKTGKPKLFLGTIFSGKVAHTLPFVRAVDDEIVSDEDLVNDVQINMTRWLAALPGRLSYEIQVKLNPYDEEGIRGNGTWAVLGLYINNKKGQRTFIDEILLGPMDPVVYYPEQTRIKSIQFEIPRIVKPAEIRVLKAGQDVFFTLDESGNVVSDIFKDDAGAGSPAPAGPGADVQTGEGATPPTRPAQAPTPQPQSQPSAPVVSPTFSQPSAAPAQSVIQSVPQEIRIIAQPGATSFPYFSDMGGRVERGATLVKTANNQYYAINPNGDRPNITQRDFEFITGPVGRITSTLRQNSFGDEVKVLQTLLRNKGYDPGAIDGSFGPRTDSAVRAFQASRAVIADGIVGPITRELLQG